MSSPYQGQFKGTAERGQGGGWGMLIYQLGSPSACSGSGCISRNTVLRHIIAKVWKKRIGVESASSFLHGYLVARSGFEATSPGLHSPHSLSLPSSVSPCELFLCHPLKAWLLPPQLSLASACHTSCLFLSVLCSQPSFPCVLVMRQCAASPIVWAQSST